TVEATPTLGAGKAVSCDSTAAGDGPGVARFEALPTGNWKLRATKTGFEPAAADATVKAGRETRTSLDLKEHAGTILVRSLPAGLAVTLDGKALGETPVRKEGVPAGDHAVSVTAEDGLALE